MTTAQRQLSEAQIHEFRSDAFATYEVQHFVDMTSEIPLHGAMVVDVGGGVGHFAAKIAVATGARTRVVDTDERSLAICRQKHPNVDAALGDALDPTIVRDSDRIACFNLVLHHLIASSDKSTRALQCQALSVWRGTEYVYVTEYIYDSYIGDLSGRLIFEITKSKALSAVCRIVGRMVPALRANTLGIGVRFRSRETWLRIFQECGFEVVREHRSGEERRWQLIALFVKSVHVDCFLLRPART